jgi:Lon protease-like protein
MTQGGERFFIEDSEVARDGLIHAQVVLMAAEATQAVPAEFAGSVAVLHHIIDELGEARFSQPLRLDDASWLGYRLAETLPLKASVKQDLLEMNDSLMRLKILWEFLKRHGLVDAD